MRAAVWIISLCVFVIIFVQSLAGEFNGPKEDAFMAVILSATYVVGPIFIMEMPIVSGLIFAVAGALVLSTATSVHFKGLQFWAALSLILALLSVLGQIERNKRAKVPMKASVNPKR